MEFELCEHGNTAPFKEGLHKDDLDRWVVDMVCKDCGAEGYVLVAQTWPKLIWDPKTLPEWKDGG